MTTGEIIAIAMKLGGYFMVIVAFVFGLRAMVLDLRGSYERVEKHVATIEDKVDAIQTTLSDIQIKAAAHDADAKSLLGYVDSIEKRVTYLERQ